MFAASPGSVKTHTASGVQPHFMINACLDRHCWDGATDGRARKGSKPCSVTRCSFTAMTDPPSWLGNPTHKIHLGCDCFRGARHTAFPVARIYSLCRQNFQRHDQISPLILFKTRNGRARALRQERKSWRTLC